MKLKKIVTIGILILFFVGIFIYQKYSLQNIKLKIINYETRGGRQDLLVTFKEKEVVQCNWNIFKPEIAFVYHDIGNNNYKNDSLEIGFYNFQKEYYLFGKWNFEYTGSTTVKNTTFPELLKMVKQDCYQFQKDYNWAETWNTERAKTELRWQWGKADNWEQEREKREQQEKEELKKILKEKGMTWEEYKKEQEQNEEKIKEIRKEIDKEYGFDIK